MIRRLKRHFVQVQKEFNVVLQAQRLGWMIRRLWLNRKPGVFVSSNCFIDRSAKIQLHHGRHFEGGQVQIGMNACLTEGVLLMPYGGKIDIGENVYIGPYCVLSGHGGLKIGKDTMIATHCVLIPSNHGFVDRNQLIRLQPSTNQGIDIGEDVWIGCDVKILDGVAIGKGCVIGAGAVVNKSLSDYSIAVGIPAKVIGMRGTRIGDRAKQQLSQRVEQWNP